MALVPVAAKITYSLKHRVVEPAWASAIVDSLHLPFSWQALFWAAVCFTAGSLLFEWRCPSIIKHQADLGGFLAAGKQLAHVLGYALEICGPERNAYRTSSQPQDGTARQVGSRLMIVRWRGSERYEFHNVGSVAADGTIASAGGMNGIETCFWSVREAAARHRVGPLVMTLACFACGLALLVWVFLANLVWVVSVGLGA